MPFDPSGPGSGRRRGRPGKRRYLSPSVQRLECHLRTGNGSGRAVGRGSGPGLHPGAGGRRRPDVRYGDGRRRLRAPLRGFRRRTAPGWRRLPVAAQGERAKGFPAAHHCGRSAHEPGRQDALHLVPLPERHPAGRRTRDRPSDAMGVGTDENPHRAFLGRAAGRRAAQRRDLFRGESRHHPLGGQRRCGLRIPPLGRGHKGEH